MLWTMWRIGDKMGDSVAWRETGIAFIKVQYSLHVHAFLNTALGYSNRKVVSSKDVFLYGVFLLP